ncbi:MAG TPA: hypothetical protein DEP47_02755, partial [Chloroflexi bacterium]|nr:hypothetical protein [Chloroflexota bacterium]
MLEGFVLNSLPLDCRLEKAPLQLSFAIMMTIKEALAFGRRQLALSSSSALDARLLLEYVLQKNHAYLVAHTDKELTTTQETHYLALIGRAA